MQFIYILRCSGLCVTYCAALVYVCINNCFYRNTGQTGTIADTGPPDPECGLATGPPGLQARVVVISSIRFIKIMSMTFTLLSINYFLFV